MLLIWPPTGHCGGHQPSLTLRCCFISFSFPSCTPCPVRCAASRERSSDGGSISSWQSTDNFSSRGKCKASFYLAFVCKGCASCGIIRLQSPRHQDLISRLDLRAPPSACSIPLACVLASLAPEAPALDSPPCYESAGMTFPFSANLPPPLLGTSLGRG